MNKKGFFSLLLLTAALLLLGALPQPATAATYSDVAGHPAESAIERWSGLKVIEGYDGRFRPDDSITRGEMAAILDRIFQYDRSSANSFVDLPDDAWYTPYCLKLNASGIMLGDGVGMRPLDQITREEAVVMMTRALAMTDLGFAAAPPYPDADRIASWAFDAVAIFDEQGCITDSDNGFRPKTPITRAETVVMLDNAIGALWRSNGLYNASVRGNAVFAGARLQLINSDISGHLILAGDSVETVILQDTQIGGYILDGNQAEVRRYDASETIEDEIFYSSKILPALPTVDRNPYAARYFTFDDNGRRSYDDGVYYTRTGIDVSEWQGDIDWNAVAADGIDFAFIRIGFRGYTAGTISADELYEQNIRGARDAGLRVGVYFYSSAVTPEEAVEEAQVTINLLRRYDIDLPVVYDWEAVFSSDSRTKNLDGATLTACAQAFCETIADAGYEPMVYAISSWAYESYDLSQPTDYDFWYAGYMTYPEFYYDFSI